MDTDAVIRSSANPLVKLARAVVAGREQGMIALEGDRLVDDALRSGLALRHVLVDTARGERAAQLAAAGLPVTLLASGLLDRISGLVTSPGVLALAEEPPSVALDALAVDARTLWLVVDGVQDPGNLGALARSAEALGASAILCVRGGVGPWNPKALRGSMGSLLRLPVHVAGGASREGGDAQELARAIARRGVRAFTAATRGGTPLERFDFRGPLAFWVGAESGPGPTATAAPLDLERVTIPMAGAAESLNVTVAASLVLFAAGRVGDASGEPGSGVRG